MLNKRRAIILLNQSYPDLMISSIVEDRNMFIAQMVKKNGEPIMGGTKGVLKDSGKTIEVNPLKYKGLIERLMDPNSK